MVLIDYIRRAAMLDSYCRLSVPEDLTAFYRVTDTIRRVNSNEFNSDIVIKRDAMGCIESICYYSAENELRKQVHYKEENIVKINYYSAGHMTQTEMYNEGMPTLKSVFNNKGTLLHTFEYQYNRKKQVTHICKKTQGKHITIEYKYDDFDRIMKRIISLNNESLLEQTYRYDILDRIVEYRDNNQRILVNRINKNCDLLSYVITDKMNNDIRIFNHFTVEDTYDYTEIMVNGHSSTVKDKSYVDNVMLKKPRTDDDDLDLIIANLFRNTTVFEQPPRPTPVSAEKMVDNCIEQRVLPISIRKRLLYSLVSKA